MEENRKFTEDSPAVHVHLEIIQSIIRRMASNSSSCKAWCITLVSAILVIVADDGKPQYALIAVIPTVLFLILDTLYLALERGFRNSYTSFIKKLHSNKGLNNSDLFVVKPEGYPANFFRVFISSFSILPFYLTLFVMIWLAKTLVIQVN